MGKTPNGEGIASSDFHVLATVFCKRVGCVKGPRRAKAGIMDRSGQEFCPILDCIN